MFRSQNCLHPPALPSFPLSFSALSVNGACPDTVGVLRETRTLTHVDPPAPILSTRLPRVSRGHSPTAAIPFRITSFADPLHLTPIESHLCKKQGRGWGIQGPNPSQPLPLFSTASKHPTHINTRNSNPLMRLLHSSLDTRGWGYPPGSLASVSPTQQESSCAASALTIHRSRHTDSPSPSTFQPSTLNLFKYNPRAPLWSPLHLGVR